MGVTPLLAEFSPLGIRESATSGLTTEIGAEITSLPDGSLETTFALPDGEVIRTTTPPPGFNPFTANNTLLGELGFPQPPADTSELEDWSTAMSDYTSDDPPGSTLQYVAGADSRAVAAPDSFSTHYINWAGYAAGTINTWSHTYVAVKGVFLVPTNTGTCSDSNEVGFWIGLGGWDNGANDLDQQGIECGDSYLGSGSAYRPFTEFAATADPVNFCGYSSWTFSAADKIYQNMSFQTSSNTAYFYLEDETSGVTHSCAVTPPSGWGYNGNVSDWIAEAPSGTAIDFHSIRFTDAYAELNSNSSWVTLGSQPVNTAVAGSSSSTYCIAPGAIGSDKASFTDSWHQATCYS